MAKKRISYSLANFSILLRGFAEPEAKSILPTKQIRNISIIGYTSVRLWFGCR